MTRRTQQPAPDRETIRAVLRHAASQSTADAHLDKIERQACEIDPDGDVPAEFTQRIVRRLELVRGAGDDHKTACRHALALVRLLVPAALQGIAHSVRQSRCGQGRSNMNLARDIEMAREFRKRQRRPLGGEISDTGLMQQIGRLPRFNLGRSAAIAAIRHGLGYLPSGQPG